MPSLCIYRLLIDQTVLGQNYQDKDNLHFLCKHHNLYYIFEMNYISGIIPSPVLVVFFQCCMGKMCYYLDRS